MLITIDPHDPDLIFELAKQMHLYDYGARVPWNNEPPDVHAEYVHAAVHSLKMMASANTQLEELRQTQ